jgi:3-oxoacyl-[acyl-carrier-protein] synthase II
MGAASALEAVICALAVYYQTVPPTINTKDVDPTFPTSLDVVQGKARSFPIRHAISNAFAFGGNVASVVFSHPAAQA